MGVAEDEVDGVDEVGVVEAAATEEVAMGMEGRTIVAGEAGVVAIGGKSAVRLFSCQDVDPVFFALSSAFRYFIVIVSAWPCVRVLQMKIVRRSLRYIT
jgi:hypothetical protein